MEDRSSFQIRVGKNGAKVQFGETDLTSAIERVEIRRPLDSAEYECWLRVKADFVIDKSLDVPGAPAACIADVTVHDQGPVRPLGLHRGRS